MRIHDIIGETAETFAIRHAAFQRQQAKRAKLRAKLTTATATANDQHRAAAAQRSRSHDKIAGIKRDLAQPKTD